jgi:hypothetical protein
MVTGILHYPCHRAETYIPIRELETIPYIEIYDGILLYYKINTATK